MLKETNGLGSRVTVLNEDTRRPHAVFGRLSSVLGRLREKATMVVRGWGVERIRVRILVERGEAVSKAETRQPRQACN